MDEKQNMTLSKSAAGFAAGALIVCGFAGGYFIAVHGAVGLAAAASSGEPAGVDFGPVWKDWNRHLKSKRFVHFCF